MGHQMSKAVQMKCCQILYSDQMTIAVVAFVVAAVGVDSLLKYYTQ